MPTQQETTPMEMHGQLLCVENQRNEALNQAAVMNGKLASAGQKILALQQQVTRLQEEKEKLEKAAEKASDGPTKTKRKVTQ